MILVSGYFHLASPIICEAFHTKNANLHYKTNKTFINDKSTPIDNELTIFNLIN